MNGVNNFEGVYAVNTLPSDPLIGKSYISNTDEIHQSGEHWVAFFFPKDSLPEYFDSFGLPPLKDGFYRFLKRFPYFNYNATHLQAPLSSICGEYCIFYITQRMNGSTASDILSLFDEKSSVYNDGLVKNFMKRHFDENVEIYDKQFINQQIIKYIQLDHSYRK